jgi:predicted kinase
MKTKGTLHFFCGKMAAGKSTRAAELACDTNAVLLSEDEWLRRLYEQEINNLDDYIHYSARLKPLLKTHVQDLLLAGISVVMDFPGNTINQRAWFREIYAEYDIPHQLHYIVASDDTCLRQLRHRSVDMPEGAKFTTTKEFHQVNRYFQPPSEDEGFNLVLYS